MWRLRRSAVPKFAPLGGCICPLARSRPPPAPTRPHIPYLTPCSASAPLAVPGKVTGAAHVARLHRVVDQSVLLRLGRGHEVVALEVLADLFLRFAGMAHVDVLHHVADVQVLLRHDLQIRQRRTREPRRTGVNHDATVGQGDPVALLAGHEDHGAHRHRYAHAVGVDGGRYVLHDIVDGQARVDLTAWAVDEQVDRLLTGLRVEKQQLGHDHVRNLGIYGRSQEDDSLLQKPAVDVVGAFTATRLLDYVRNERHSYSFGSAARVDVLLIGYRQYSVLTAGGASRRSP